MYLLRHGWRGAPSGDSAACTILRFREGKDDCSKLAHNLSNLLLINSLRQNDVLSKEDIEKMPPFFKFAISDYIEIKDQDGNVIDI